MPELFKPVHNSRTELNQVYFWTSTIKDWIPLLKFENFAQLIIDIWSGQVPKGQIILYGFVIMPNHLHVLWELIKLNGKEMPHASFNKVTAHEIVKVLKKNNPELLGSFYVNDKERKFRIWQRDPLAILMDTKEKN